MQHFRQVIVSRKLTQDEYNQSLLITNQMHMQMGNEETPVKSLQQFKARMCDCGNPICFGSLTSRDVAWLVRYTNRLRARVGRITTDSYEV